MDEQLRTKLTSNARTKPLVAPFEKLRETLATHPPAERNDDRERHARAGELLDIAERSFSALNLTLATSNMVSPGVSAITALEKQFVTSGSLRQADAQLEAFADWVRTLPVVDLSYPMSQVHSTLDEVHEELRRLTSERDASATLGAELEARLRSEIETLTQAGEAAKVRLADAITAGERAYRSSLAERNAEIEEDRTEIVKAAEQAVEEAEAAVDEIRALQGIIADESLSAGYEKAAADERDQADRYRRATLWLGGIAATVAAVAAGLAFLVDDGLSVERGIAKAGFIAIVSTLAVYCSHQARGHRRMARNHTDTALRLFNLGGYIKELPAEKRGEVRERLVDEFFLGKVFADDGKEVLGATRRLAQEDDE